jgi:hypothetical protein
VPSAISGLLEWLEWTRSGVAVVTKLFQICDWKRAACHTLHRALVIVTDPDADDQIIGALHLLSVLTLLPLALDFAGVPREEFDLTAVVVAVTGHTAITRLMGYPIPSKCNQEPEPKRRVALVLGAATRFPSTSNKDTS